MNFFSRLFNSFSPFLVLRIYGNSMHPTFREKDKVISIHKALTHFKKKDMCICRDPRTKRLLVKRIKDIKDNKYFVVGDNKEESTDSRDFGWLDKNYLVGKVIYPKDK